MRLSSQSLEELRDHWTVRLIDPSDLERSDKIVNERLAQRAVGEEINFNFGEETGDDELLERVALAYQLAALEGLDALSREPTADAPEQTVTKAGCFRAFGIRRLTEISPPTTRTAAARTCATCRATWPA